MARQQIIQVRDLWAKFGEHTILSDINFETFENEITVILGGSGSGKTTVLKHLIGLYPIEQGSVEVLHRKLEEMSEREKSEFFLKIGVFYQNGALLNSLTVAENVALPLQQHTRLSDNLIDELVRLKLSLVNLEQAYDLFPSQLSGGMRKRAALARAIAMDPPLLFFDEPGAGLDPVLLAALDDLILKLRDQLGVSITLVTHEVASILRLADRIVFLDNGQVLFSGTLSEALSAGIETIDHFFEKGSAQNGSKT
ncbi:ATP-binding cassette domain-containing protein [candidate division KSB1 bacterium]|nr:ATP-binding cassette domain-containing protein [candidate division KSB1 bacterium]NIR69461.1 ATP-binding cassette domain-containing protein [candidate division KSB1 bacterium]NIS22810.1 ATP-binding cassette domain-containing protein [candidate division KSB1 bacterium]NIT69650.1 ATP-binding cassette domain-containing protein [candidate division KSB1 bacterium]NIU23319.1 ATP-binding cassette domain-containing protein [candidate division KSB1 bacterium]